VAKIPLDVHLMIVEPIKYVKGFADAGSDFITVHIEACYDNAEETINAIKQEDVIAGISIKPNTPVKNIENLLDKVGLVLVMTVEPGFGGQEFMKDCLQKVRKLDEIRQKQGLDFYIEVDGGINSETAKLCRDAGVDVLVAGSYVYRAKNAKQAIDSLKA
jgi:ribulose-phosphate 3-epimerase